MGIRWSSIDRCLRTCARRISTPARKRYSRSINDRVVNVDVKDPGAFEDIDTPGDYQKDLRSQSLMADQLPID